MVSWSESQCQACRVKRRMRHLPISPPITLYGSQRESNTFCVIECTFPSPSRPRSLLRCGPRSFVTATLPSTRESVQKVSQAGSFAERPFQSLFVVVLFHLWAGYECTSLQLGTRAGRNTAARNGSKCWWTCHYLTNYMQRPMLRE